MEDNKIIYEKFQEIPKKDFRQIWKAMLHYYHEFDYQKLKQLGFEKKNILIAVDLVILMGEKFEKEKKIS